MDFWDVYEEERVKAEFGKDKLRVASRDRINLSLSTVERYATVLGMNQGTSRKFSEETRYALIKELTHDVLISVYDVNTTHSVLLRLSQPLDHMAVAKISGELKRLRKPNVELRAIGMQNNDTELLNSLDMLHTAFAPLKPNLMELELFGAETRHMAFDTKLGMSFNLLLLNRIYKPHELANAQTLEDFNKKKSELKFV